MDPLLSSIIINLTSSLLYDIAKRGFLSEDGTRHFKNSVIDTVNYFHKQGIELNEEYFNNFSEDSELQDAVKQFYDGINYVSTEIYINSLLRTDFYMFDDSVRKQKAEEIVEYFINQLTNNILKDPKTNALYLNSVLKINFTQSNKFIIDLRILVQSLLEKVKLKLDIIDEKQDFMLNRLGELATIKDIERVVTSFVKEKDDTNKSKSKFRSSLKHANDLFEKGLYDTAREEYIVMLKKENLTDEEKWKLNRNIAMTYLITNDLINSIPYFKEAFKVLPNEYRGKLQNIFAIMLEIGEEEALNKFNSDFVGKELDYDERLLKMNILLKLGKLEEAKSLFDDKSLEDPNNRYAYSKILYEMKDYEKAIEEIQNVIKFNSNPEIIFDYGIYKLASVLEKIKSGKYLANRQPVQIIEELQEVKMILNKAILKLEKTQNKRFIASAIFNRGVVNGYLGFEDESRTDFETAENLGLRDFEIFLNIGISYIKISNFYKAVHYFKKAYDIDPLKALPNLLDALLYNKEYSEVKNLCLKHIDYPNIKINVNNLKIYLSLAISLNRELLYKETDNILFEVNKLFPTDYDYILANAKILWERGDKITSITFLECKKDDSNKNKEVVYIKLADYYLSNNQWKEAKIIYQDYLDVDEIIRLNYLTCLYNLKEDEEIIEYAKKLLDENNLENKDKVKETLGYSYLAVENFNDALPIFKELAIKTKNCNFFYNWAFCEIRLINKENAIKVAIEAEREFKDKFKELAMISSIYFNAGEKKKALDIAFKSAQNLPEDMDVNKNFVSMINSLINDPDLVTEEQKKLYNHLMQNWDILFPGLKFFEKIPIEPDFKTIREKLEESKKYGLELISMYERKQIPISFYSLQSGLNIYEAWKNLSMSYLSKIFAYNTSNPRKQCESLKFSKNVVIDPIAFFTMYELELHHFLINLFDEFYFSQGLLDELIQHRDYLDLASVQGRKSITSFKGKLTMFEVSADEIKKEIIKIEDMIGFVKQHIRGTNKSFVEKRIANMLEKSSVQAINISLELDIPIICDDSILNDIMSKELTNYKYSCTLYFIQSLVDSGKISNDRFKEIILKIIWMNYYFVPITANILLFNIESQEFSKYNLNKRAIDSLRDLSQIREPSLRVVAEFIIKIYFMDNIINLNKSYWVDYILNALNITNSTDNYTLKILMIFIKKYLSNLVSENYINEDNMGGFYGWFKKLLNTRK